jgi:hypothetical protein
MMRRIQVRILAHARSSEHESRLTFRFRVRIKRRLISEDQERRCRQRQKPLRLGSILLQETTAPNAPQLGEAVPSTRDQKGRVQVVTDLSAMQGGTRPLSLAFLCDCSVQREVLKACMIPAIQYPCSSILRTFTVLHGFVSRKRNATEKECSQRRR